MCVLWGYKETCYPVVYAKGDKVGKLRNTVA